MLVENIKPIISWLHTHHQLAGLITFLFAFAESLAIVGLFVPGAIIMIAIGILIGTGVLHPITTMLWAMSGAFAGDVLSYWLGYRYHRNIRQMWPMRTVPTWLESGEKFFAAHGGKGIFWGRFLGPIRPILPLIAGSMRMSPVRFVLVDFISAALWAPIYMLPGILIGAASMALAPHDATRVTLYIVGILLLIWLIIWLIKCMFSALFNTGDYAIKQMWQTLLLSPRTAKFCQLLSKASSVDDHSQLTLLLLGLLCLTLFIVVTISAINITPVQPMNTAIVNFFHSIYSPLWHRIMVALTLFFDPRSLALLWGTIAVWFAWQRRWSELLHWIIIGCMVIGLAGLLKRALLVPRPMGLIHTPLTGSYPSGHVALATAFFGFAAYLLAENRTRTTRNLIYTGTLVLIILNGLSRLYLGVHWFTDVAGAVLLGLTILTFALISYRREPRPSINTTQFISIILPVLVLCWGVFLWHDYQKYIHNYTPRYTQYSLPLQTWWQTGLQGKPLYRMNRFGQRVQTMNIEWLGNINEIRKTLEKQGWHSKPLHPWLATIHYLGKDNSKIPPLLPVVNQGRSPTLIMMRTIAPPPHLIILRLWKSNAKVADGNNTIWVGTVNYQHNLKLQQHIFYYWRGFKRIELENPLPITYFFTQFLYGYNWKKLTFDNYSRVNNWRDQDWDGSVLLIRPAEATTKFLN